MTNDEDSAVTDLLAVKVARNTATTYDYDVVLDSSKHLGRYQLLLFAFACTMALTNGMLDVGAVFLLAIPPFRCRIPEIDYQQNCTGYSEEYLMNLSTPRTETGFDGCRRYEYNYTYCSNGSLDYLLNNPRPATVNCDLYHYDESEEGRTAVSEWDLVCDRLILGTVASAAVFGGALIGCMVGGVVLDYVGRKYSLLVMTLGILIFGITCAFSTGPLMFGMTRFLMTLIGGYSFEAAFVYVMEIAPEAFQSDFGMIYQAFYPIGYSLLSLMAYFCRDWRKLQFAIALVPLPYLLQWIFMPESPRWLFYGGKNEKGIRMSELIAKRNGQKLTEDIWKDAVKEVDCDAKRKHTLLTVFRKPRMRVVALQSIFCLFTAALTFYGLSLSIGEYSGNLYVNNALSGLADIFASIAALPAVKRFGRRKSLVVSLVTAGITCLLATVINCYSFKVSGFGTLATVVALISKFLISAAYNITYHFIAELFPTAVRGTVLGIGATMGLLATFISPYALYLQYFVPWLPGVIFCVMSLLGGLVGAKLPETRNHHLMATIEEAEEFYRQSTNV